eukprot:scaffold11421_cov67-Phaeocystis_antarctica.AAC.15
MSTLRASRGSSERTRDRRRHPPSTRPPHFGLRSASDLKCASVKGSTTPLKVPLDSLKCDVMSTRRGYKGQPLDTKAYLALLECTATQYTTTTRPTSLGHQHWVPVAWRPYAIAAFVAIARTNFCEGHAHGRVKKRTLWLCNRRISVSNYTSYALLPTYSLNACNSRTSQAVRRLHKSFV